MVPTEYDFQNSMKNVRSYPFLHTYFPVDRYIVRPLAALVVRAVYRTAVTPNQLTLCSFVLGLAAGLVFLGGEILYFRLGGVLALISTVFDCADGMLARAKNMGSRYGAFLDLFLDRIVDFVVLVGISRGLYTYTQDQRYLVFGLLTVALYFLQSSLFYLINSYLGHGRLGEAGEAKVLAGFLIFVLSLLGRLEAILAAVFLMGFISTIAKLIRIFRWGKDQSVDPGS